MTISAFLLTPPPPSPSPPLFHRPSAVVFPKFRLTSAVPPPWRRCKATPRCVSQGGRGGSAAELERELAAELERELAAELAAGGEEWMKIGRLEERCGGGGGKGVVEQLECLEREAIMGEDEGRDPTDYNRRAMIFRTSSRVFQALKQHSEQDREEKE